MPKRQIKGKIVSTKMGKTVVVTIDMSKRHRMYDKVVKKNKRIKARTDIELKVGDTVIAEEAKPSSKQVAWTILRKVEEQGK